MSTGIEELIKTSASVNEIEASSISKKLPSISKDLLKNVLKTASKDFNIIYKYIDKYDLFNEAEFNKIPLSEEFIDSYADKVNWTWISKYQKLSEQFIEKFQEKVYWSEISWNQKLSEQFIEKFQDKVDWSEISCKQKLSEQFIERFQHKVKDKANWRWISYGQKLSEQFIEKFQEKINWEDISSRQKLSERFIYNNFEKLNLTKIVKYQELSYRFITFLYKNDFEQEFKILKSRSEYSEYAKKTEEEVKVLIIEMI